MAKGDPGKTGPRSGPDQGIPPVNARPRADTLLDEEEIAGVSEAAAEDRTLANHGVLLSPSPPRTLDSVPPPPSSSAIETTSPGMTVGALAAASESAIALDSDALIDSSGADGDEMTLVVAPESRAEGQVRAADVVAFDGAVPLDGPFDGTETMLGSVRRRAVKAPVGSWNVHVAPSTHDPLCGRLIAAGKYLLESVIGRGAIGIVFKALHCDLGRTVAIKVLHPRFRDEPALLDVFRSEARAASVLEHPHVSRVYDYGQEPDGLVYIVMEYLSGYTLGDVIESRGRLGHTRAVDVMLQICAALGAAHDRGIVHRDVKPDNIVLVPTQDDEGEPTEFVKVCDFGIAALTTARSNEDLGETQRYAAGTPEYMSPEQATGAPFTAASDVYACGIVFYEMVTGRVPFRAEHKNRPFEVVMKQVNEPPVPPSNLADVPPALEAIILRALEKPPARRFATARDLRASIRRAFPRR